MNLPIDYEAHFRVPEDAGYTREQDNDLSIVEHIQDIVESFESEIRAYDKNQEKLFHASKVIRMDRAEFLASDISNLCVRSWIKDVLLSWSDDELTFDELLGDYNSTYLSHLYQRIQDGEFDYD